MLNYNKYVTLHFKSKLQNTGTWPPAAWLPPRLWDRLPQLTQWLLTLRCKSELGTNILNYNKYVTLHFKSKLQNTGTWPPAAWLPPRLWDRLPRLTQRLLTVRCKSELGTHMVNYNKYVTLHLKSKLQNTGTWPPAAWLPPRLCCYLSTFLDHLRRF